MPQIVPCPHCRGGMVLEPSHVGHKITCPHCRKVLVPTASDFPQLLGTASQTVVASVMGKKEPRSLFGWLKKGVTKLIDADREERTNAQAIALYNALATQKHAFQLDATVSHIGINAADLDYVKEMVYQRILNRSWSDSKLTQSEGNTLIWVASSLRIPSPRVTQMNWQIGQQVFQRLLSTALEDGHIDELEETNLAQTARSLGTTVQSLMQGFFREQGENLLLSVFLSMLQDGNVTSEEWTRVLQTTSRLGFNKSELLAIVGPHAHTFVEHVLADAKTDGMLSQHEDRALQWLLEQFVQPGDFRAYVEREIHELRLMTDIHQGKLPSVVGRIPVELKAGEIAHFHGTAVFGSVRHMKAGPRFEHHSGHVTITDSRLIFSSVTKSLTLIHRNVVECNLLHNGVEVRTTGKGGGAYNFQHHNRMAYCILKTAVGRANQTIVEQQTGLPTRHIPRDVRQRVWQRYGGHCADCNSSQYLEFDHIIPFSKGGGNTDSNVQLLCRGCNGKKSDHI